MLAQYHVKLKPGDVAPYVLLPGDPGRVSFTASFWDKAEKIAENREYVTYTGTYKGVPISCTSTGIGCPSTAIALEELARVGATTFIRIGTCGTFQDHIANGDIVIFDSAMRYDGASHLRPARVPRCRQPRGSPRLHRGWRSIGLHVSRRHHPFSRRILCLPPTSWLLVQQLLAVELARALSRPQTVECNRRRDGSQHHPCVGAGVGPAGWRHLRGD